LKDYRFESPRISGLTVRIIHNLQIGVKCYESTKSPKKWTKSEDILIRKLAKSGVSTKSIAKQLGRTEDAIRNEASKKNISLKPKDVRK